MEFKDLEKTLYYSDGTLGDINITDASYTVWYQLIIFLDENNIKLMA